MNPRSVGLRSCCGMLIPVLLALAAPGCRHTRSVAHSARNAPLSGAGLRGERLVVLPGEEESVDLAVAVARHLSTLPVRVSRVQDYGEERAIEPGAALDLEEWREWAWDRRMPFLLVVGSAADESTVASLLPSPGGEAIGRWDLGATSRSAVPVELRSRIREDLGLEEKRPDGHPTTWMICSAAAIEELRIAALVDPTPAVLDRIDGVAEDCPIDPGPIEIGGVVRWRLGERDEARRLFRRAQAHNPEGTSQLPILARSAGRAGMDDLEIELWELAVAIWPGRADYGAALAERLEERGDPSRAAEILLSAASRDPGPTEMEPEAGDRAARLTDAALSADVRYLLGWMLYLEGRHDDALASYGEARPIYESLGEDLSVATCRNNMGVALVEMGRAVAAIPHLRAALEARTEASAERANTLYNLGAAQEAVGRLYDADEAWRLAADTYGAVGIPDDQFDTVLDVLLNQGEIGSRDGVEAAAELALALVGRGDEASRGRVLDAAGVARARVDLFEESLEALDEALRIWSSLGDRLHEGQTRYNMAIPHVGRGDIEAALATLEEARAIALELGDTESVVAIDAQLRQIERMR